MIARSVVMIEGHWALDGQICGDDRGVQHFVRPDLW